MKRNFMVVAAVFALVAVAIGIIAARNPSPANPIDPGNRPSANEAAEWQTYTNTEAGYIIKYPPGLIPSSRAVSGLMSSVTFSDGPNEPWNIDISVATTSTEDIDDLADAENNGSFNESSIIEHTNVAGFDAVVANSNASLEQVGDERYVYFIADGKLYTIGTRSLAPPDAARQVWGSFRLSK
jgi:hypothetical protein